MALQVVSLDAEQLEQLLKVGTRIANALEALVELGATEQLGQGALCPHCGETDPEKVQDTSAGNLRRITCLSCTKSTSTEAP